MKKEGSSFREEHGLQLDFDNVTLLEFVCHHTKEIAELMVAVFNKAKVTDEEVLHVIDMYPHHTDGCDRVAILPSSQFKSIFYK